MFILLACRPRTEMMETKLWIALCAILVIHSGTATPDNNHTAALPVPDPVPSSTNHSLRIPETDPGSNATGSLNSTTSANITITSERRKNNVITNASDATSTKSEHITHSTLSPSQSHPTAPVPTHNGTIHMNQTFLSTSVTPTPSSNHNSSQLQNISEQPSQATALPASSTPTSEPPKAVSITVTPPATTTKSSASNTSSPQNPTTSQLTRNTSQSNRQSTITQPNSQTSAHTKDPVTVNRKDTMTDRGSPALDPLLAGLVSAFIIAAVIITLLLFLKLRRRGNGPEFRRLQDLPMDDMEDTPLSMYSY